MLVARLKACRCRSTMCSVTPWVASRRRRQCRRRLTLSGIEAYTTDHLVDAADHWDGLADRWEDAHWQVRSQAHVLDWQGAAADALRARTASDYTVASGQAAT